MATYWSVISQTERSSATVLVAGEALIDFVPSEDGRTYRALPGGSPFNVAVGLARLGVATGYLGKLSTDALGRRLRRRLLREGIASVYVRDDPGPTTLAVVTKEPGVDPEYAFYGDHPADRQLRIEDVPETLPADVQALHLGSYAMARAPVGETLTQLMRREADHRVISFDPNIRPSLIPDLDRYREQLEEWVRLSRIVKLSIADLEILFPGTTTDALADRWLGDDRSRLIVVTQGAHGMLAFTSRHALRIPAKTVQVVDSVGAGDASTAGLLAWLIQHGRLTPQALDTLSEDDVMGALNFASTVAAITCTRPGADPPRLDEVTAAMAQDPVA